ncbi:MAG: phosphoribosylformylglycinamidine synthase, partial [Methylotenera sp.]|nr:phosphoribosylformylglycinamidine synthase [Methylotenera sp.]
MSQSKPNPQMISLRGSAALSPFRVEKIQNKLNDICPNIGHLYAEFWHFAWVDNAAITAEQASKLNQILTYGPSLQAEDPLGELILVLPRVGTISPWASRATDIVQHCGLPEIARVERGIAYYVQTKNGQALTAAERQQLLPLIHDRMTESVFSQLQDAAKLYHTASPVPLSTVDILQGGKAVLNQANSEMGLALSSDEVDYLVDNFT